MGNTVGQITYLVDELGNLMIILSIDTATAGVSVAISDGARVLASSEMRSEKQHAEVLLSISAQVCLRECASESRRQR
jgi:hypothetical protein